MVAGIARRTAGFSLVELLVVVSVMAVLAVGVTLAFSRPGGGAGDAARLTGAVEAARDRALATQARHGLAFDDRGWRVLRFDAVAGRWQDTGGGGRWGGRVDLPAGRRDGARPAVEIAPDGRMSALRIGLFEGASRQVCRARGWEPVTCG